MKYEPVKSISAPVRDDGSFFPRDYNMNLYRGCCHGCIYCDSRSKCYQVEDFGRVRCKKDALAILESELSHRKKTGVIGMGAMSDPYNPFEKKFLQTRGALALLDKYGFGVGITTKSGLVSRDADVLSSVTQKNIAHVSFSITCADDALSKCCEPYAPPSSERFAALDALARAGVCAGVWLNPVMPFITDSPENIRLIIERAAQCGAAYVICHYGFTMREGSRDWLFGHFDRSFPGMREKYAQTYGNSYICACENADVLYRLHMSLCEKHGLISTAARLNSVLRAKQTRQTSLF